VDMLSILAIQTIASSVTHPVQHAIHHQTIVLHVRTLTTLTLLIHVHLATALVIIVLEATLTYAIYVMTAFIGIILTALLNLAFQSVSWL